MRGMELASLSFGELLDHVSAKTPAPGGGAVAASVGALAAALGSMVVNYSAGKKDLAAHAPAHEEAIEQLERARWMMLELAVEDALAYEALNAALRLAKDDPARAARVEEGAVLAVAPPMAMIAACAELLRLLESLAGKTNRQLRSDLVIAAIFAEAAARASERNVSINAGLQGAEAAADQLGRAAEIVSHCAERLKAIEAACE